jgi:hypothetical protein
VKSGFFNSYQFLQFTKAKSQNKIPDQAKLERGHPGTCWDIARGEVKSGRPYDENICVR